MSQHAPSLPAGVELDLPLERKEKCSEIPKEDSSPITSASYLKSPVSLMQTASTAIINKLALVLLQESALALYCFSMQLRCSLTLSQSVSLPLKQNRLSNFQMHLPTAKAVAV